MEWLVISALAFFIGAMLWIAYTVSRPDSDDKKKQ